MRPLGVSLIAGLTWFLGALWALAAVSVIGFSHLGARLFSSMSEGRLLERITAGMGTTVGVLLLLVAVIYVAVGVGLWNLKSWARMATIFFVALGLVLGLRNLIEYHHVLRLVRTVVDVAIVAYLLMPDVKKVFV
ncbi:MAG TPA: DUF2127 domain-containing protein [Candidatus Sulfotelmatobacter sp.]|nr:DUF2127 domain-containing protein [Candidatus Sulfotelmatobacter sp.]